MGSKKNWFFLKKTSLSPEALQLGSILGQRIVDDDPKTILNLHSVQDIEKHNVLNEVEEVDAWINAACNNGIGVKAALSSILGPRLKIEGTKSSESTGVVEAFKYRKSHAYLSQTYMDRAVLAERVQEYIKSTAFQGSLYLVVGIAVASQLDRESGRAKEMSIGADGAVPSGQVPIDVELHVSGWKGSHGLHGAHVASEVVVAYRIRRFRYSRGWLRKEGRWVKMGEDESKNADYSLGTGDTDPASEEEDDDDNELARFTSVDVADVTFSAGDEDNAAAYNESDNEASDQTDQDEDDGSDELED